MGSNVVYAIVKAGGRQEKVSVGDIIVVNRMAGEIGDAVDLTPIMLVDGGKITTGAKELAKVAVKAEIVREEKGPKISIVKYKNKTGYRKRQGHRQKLTRLKITGIDNG
ncbi:MAG: 50S ribosomal protein L21 [Bowdeniella nasicola]|nr:50S ribosomal protein L21 [Bowdeniella nasicola]